MESNGDIGFSFADIHVSSSYDASSVFFARRVMFLRPDLPEVGGTTGFGMPFNACGNCPAANAVIGLIYVPCAVAAAMSAACCCNEEKYLLQNERSHASFTIASADNYLKPHDLGKCPHDRQAGKTCRKISQGLPNI